jgi:voltage-gated potassium channel
MSLRQRTAEILEQRRANDRPSGRVNLFLILLIALNVIAIFAETVDSVFQRYEGFFWFFEIFSVAIFTAEYGARVWSSIDLEGGKYSSPFIGRVKYMLTPMALIDLVAILPFYLSLYLSFDLRFLRVLRLLRLFKLTRYSPALGALLDIIQQEADALLAAFVVLLTMLVISAGGIYLFENELQPESFGSMPEAMWWAIVTLTTVGYGDVVPVTTMGKVFGGLIGLIGISMIALPAAILASGFVENVSGRKQRYSQYIQRFTQDGVLDENDRWRLEELRKELGLDTDEALQLLDTVMHNARRASPSQCPHCGGKLN